MTERDANSLLMGAGTPSVKFEVIGDGIKGKVIAHRTAQQTEWQTRAPLFWKNGKPSTEDTGDPVLQPVFTIFVASLVSDADDGKRDLYCGSRNIREAIREAITATGAREMEMGATLTVQYTSGTGNTGDPKQYSAVYERPTVPVGGDAPAQPAATAAPGSLVGGS